MNINALILLGFVFLIFLAFNWISYLWMCDIEFDTPKTKLQKLRQMVFIIPPLALLGILFLFLKEVLTDFYEEWIELPDDENDKA